jgi:hypothetical protein
MICVSCDLCGKEIQREEETHYIVKIEIVAVPDPDLLLEDDLAADNLEAVSNLLKAEANGEIDLSETPAKQQLRYDLCSQCREKFLKNPLRPEPVSHFDFSQN